MAKKIRMGEQIGLSLSLGIAFTLFGFLGSVLANFIWWITITPTNEKFAPNKSFIWQTGLLYLICFIVAIIFMIWIVGKLFKKK